MQKGGHVMVVFWAAVLVAAVIIEAATVGLATIWFAVGALAALIAAAFSANIGVQIGIFIVVSLLLLIFTRPILKKLFPVRFQATNFDRCIGKTAVAEEEIDNIAGTGCIKIDGVFWTARCEDSTKTVKKGELVRIVKIEGVKAFVESVSGSGNQDGNS